MIEREVASRMVERLDYVRLSPQRILDLGCGAGEDLCLLQARYPDAQGIGLDIAWSVLPAAQAKLPWLVGFMRRFLKKTPNFVCADARKLPLHSNTIQLAWSNLMLYSLGEPHEQFAVFKEIHRILEVGGLFMFSTLGPDTFKENRAKAHHNEDLPQNYFMDMHDVGDSLLAAGFADPVMDMEIIQLVEGKQAPVTFELVYGHAWKAAPRKRADGRSVIKFEQKGK